MLQEWNSLRALSTVLLGIFATFSASEMRGLAIEAHTGLISPGAIVASVTTGKIYAVDSERGIVTAIHAADDSTAEIKVGDSPVSIAINEVSNTIWIANEGSGSVSVIDGNTDVVRSTIDVGPRPYAIAVNPATNTTYVSNTFSSLLSIIDGATLAISKIKAGSADAIKVNSPANKIYLLSYESNNLSILDGGTHQLTQVALGDGHLWGIATDDATNTIYLTHVGSGTLQSINVLTGSRRLIKTEGFPSAVSFNPTSGKIYVVNYGSDSVSIIDSRRWAVIATVHVGAQPQALANDSRSDRLYVANTHGDTISVIDGAKNSLVATLSTGSHPFALAIDAASGKLYSRNFGDSSLPSSKLTLNIHAARILDKN